MRWTLRALLPCIVLFFAQGTPVFEIHANADCLAPSLVGIHVTDNGDGDGIADTNETLQIGISLRAHCQYFDGDGPGLNGCVARLSTESPAIACIPRAEVLIGTLEGNATVVTPDDAFEVIVGNVDRDDLGLTPDDPLAASLNVDISCVYVSEPFSVQRTFSLPLDFNVLDQGQTPVAWEEDFEAGGSNPADLLQGTAFEAQNLDEGLPGNSNLEGLANSDGWRCQYSDPDWHNASSYNHAQGEVCYPAMNLGHANAIFWNLDGSLVPGTPDGGRAYRGEKSMYYGVFLQQADEVFTTPLSTVEAVATRDLINLGAGNPQLSFWQQISMADWRGISTPYSRNVDRGMLQIRLHDSAGGPTSDWMNLQPIQNSYAQQAADNYYNCLFDPIDDGNTEDDFFDPTDPERDLGPSSTCYPEFSWSYQGSTTGAFDVEDIGFATTPPDSTDVPDLGLGTWVQAKVDLSEFRGRRARLRFLVTSLKGTAETHVGQFGPDRDYRDDGWWVDDFRIDETLTEPALFTNDLFLLGSCGGTGESCIAQCRESLVPCSASVPCGEGEGDCVRPCPPGDVCSGAPPECTGVDCLEAHANAFVEPIGPLNPESLARHEDAERFNVNLAAPVDAETGAEPSWVDACMDGYKEYRICISGDPDGDGPGLPDADCGDAWDRFDCELCSDWSFNSLVADSQDVITTYAAEVRCSTAPDCRDGRKFEVDVTCSFGATNTYGLRDVRALDKTMLTWRGPVHVDWLRGSFLTSEEIGDYVADLTDSASDATSIPMDGDPPAGTGYYYLVKADGTANASDLYYCATKTWRSGGNAEIREPARNQAFGNP